LATFLGEDFAGFPGRHDSMQISALSTIIAAQQARSPAPARPAVNTPAAKTAAVAPSPVEEFAPLAFTAQTTAAPEDAPAKPVYPANAPLGSQVDIRI
jgi:hypothetical protein